ncbi:uncharacterized protein LOC127882379 isoform X2 [Dreissena polymorpha]|uniref:uncharacterized protein LOC127882379 isoform X2 n=1 Tax=Dreissena polymorpha TaxID=45954 RepID=UPI002263CE7C|nr:uncharacterized protein LOC127882379 isoform X2 [Dreissena polymorpha]
MAVMNGLFWMCAFTLIVAAVAKSDKPLVNVRLLCRSTIEVMCNMSDGSYGIWTFYRIRGSSENKQNIGKIVSSERECSLTTLQTADTQCSCNEDHSVICKISAYMIMKSGDQWQCSKFINRDSHFSVTVTVPIQETIECTTTSSLQHITKDETTLTKTTSLTVLSETVSQVVYVKTNAESQENNTTTESANITTARNTNNTAELNREESDKKREMTRLALLIAGPFVVFDIGLVLFIYRKKLLSGLKRDNCQVDDRQVNTNDNPTAGGNVNIPADMNNSGSSNAHSALKEAVAILCIDGRNPTQQCGINDLQPDIAELNDDDLLYSTIKDTAVVCQGAEAMMKSGPDNVNKDISIYIPLDDDPLYSSVKQRPPNCTDRGACGFSADGFVKSEKKISGDLQYRCYGEFEDKTVLSVLNHDAELYSLAKNVDPMYSTVNKKTQNRLNVTLVNALDVNRADPLYSVVDKRDKIAADKATENRS